MDRMTLDTIELAETSDLWLDTMERSRPAVTTPVPLPVTLGRFSLHRQIGSGKQGDVYLGSYRKPDGQRQKVALKVARTGATCPAKGVHQEGRVLRDLSHQNIVKWVGGGCDFGVHYFAMEWVDGWTVRQIRRLASVPLFRVLNWSVQLCQALEACHGRKKRGSPAPVIHCDLKANNLLIDREGRLKLLDFGIALDTMTESERRTQIVGTAAYMAPEQIAKDPLDARTDVFSAGALIYEFATGERLFDGADLHHMLQERLAVDEALAGSSKWQTLREVCPELVPVIKRCVRRNPERRFPSARALALRIGLLCPRVFGHHPVDWLKP